MSLGVQLKSLSEDIMLDQKVTKLEITHLTLGWHAAKHDAYGGLGQHSEFSSLDAFRHGWVEQRVEVQMPFRI